MNILFLTIGRMESIEAHSIYADLLRCFRNHGHEVYTISPYEKRLGKETELINEKHAHLLHVKTGNVTKSSNLIEKGFAQLSLERVFIKAIKEFFSDVKFDLVLYSTPPITFYKAIDFVKKRDGAKSYLLLKDIFPQNAVDLGMMNTTGPKSLIYRYFRRKEKKLYTISDRIGCMSPANVEYLLEHNPEIDASKVEVCPNAIEVIDKSIDKETRIIIRNKYGIPLDKTVFVYGGNLGKPQSIPFLIECLKTQRIKDAFFLIVGDGTEYGKLDEFIKKCKPANVKLMRRLPKEDYDAMVAACDVGLIILDHRFTIPNFPSRLLTYQQANIPVLAATDNHSDLVVFIRDYNFGWWLQSGIVSSFINKIDEIVNMEKSTLSEYGKRSYYCLCDLFNVNDVFNQIIDHFD